MDKILPLLIWAMPVSFLLHFTEEFFFPGGFITWFHRYRPKCKGTKPSHYVAINGLGFLLILAAAIHMSISHSGYGALLIVFGMLSCNGIFTHLLGAVRTRSYSPGMVTSVVLYLPLTVLSYLTIIPSGRLDPASLLLCIAFSPLLELYSVIRGSHGAGKAV